MFKLFQEEIVREGSLVVANRVDEGDRCLYYMEYYSHSEFKWTVKYYPNDKQIKCCCLMYESFGLPCCHMIVVMKYEHLLAIPPCLIMQRWTRRARPEAQQPTIGEISRTLTRTARYGILSSDYNLMSFYASHEEESFQQARQVGEQMTSWTRKRWEMRNNGSKNEVGATSVVASKFGVADPVVVKPKGRPAHNYTSPKQRAPRKCKHCKVIGHDKRTCPKLLSNKGAIMKTVKRKSDAPTRRSKWLATCKVVSVSPETSTEIEIEWGGGGGNQC
ncbi:hypothetical protein Vadar_015598 [Vaccinium darrowii]|uniref:Uncharacterized protein n=1 Tax=Vaccinium darrowii TaxID=229202 RepID=A0ACB7YWT4_9ERIC|nr:hypothetical protein Vadar_015598 [Vaccinium darrowii]